VSPIIHRGIEQGTPEWFALKAGKWSASKAAVIMGGLDTKGLADLVQDIAWERVYGPTEGGYKSKAMERGNELEPEGRDWYAFAKGVTVEQVCFVEHATVPNVGWSPDGLIGRGALEAKCPLHRAWMEVKRKLWVPAEYRWQCRWAFWTGQLEWLDFVPYHPKAGGLIVSVERDESTFAQMEERVAMLEKRVAEWVDVLSDRKAA
jgi:putative phage-type endonuclease